MTETIVSTAKAESIRLLSRGVAKLMERGDDQVEILIALTTVMLDYLEFIMPQKTQAERVEFLTTMLQSIKPETIQ